MVKTGFGGTNPVLIALSGGVAEEPKAYPIRLGNLLLADMAAASVKFEMSKSEIFCAAVKKARRLGNVVASKNNNDDHTGLRAAESEVLKVYLFDPAPENDAAFFRECLRVYLAGHDLTPEKPGADEQYKRQCVQTEAALMRTTSQPPTKAMIKKYEAKKKRLS